MKNVLYVLTSLLILQNSCTTNTDSLLVTALEAEKWIKSGSIRDCEKVSWLPDPTDTTFRSDFLYHGNAGVILFYVELYNTTKDDSYLTEAEYGGNFLIDHLPDTIPSALQVGFYTGLAGASFTLEQIYRAGNNQKFRDQAVRYLDLILEAGNEENGGLDWEGLNDIIYGSSGIGLYLLWAHQNMNYEKGLQAAIQIGNNLLHSMVESPEGGQWPMTNGTPEPVRYMPNFSHGTAGVSYFLASLYEVTRKEKFLDAAISGADYMSSISDEEGLVCHHIPGGEELHYLGWCHGPVGTSRLYYKLHQITGDKQWMDKITRSAHSLIHSGIPEQPQPGFWNNVSQCCGSAGVAEYFLNLYQISGNQEYLDFSHHLTNDLIQRATEDELGLKWIQAEHRTQPDLLIAHTGYMQGAAGIGIWLLHLDGFVKANKPVIILPDSPFTY